VRVQTKDELDSALKAFAAQRQIVVIEVVAEAFE
jgi:thiamine pyrophosphate-dependent acetolactate synthase large subunit-like protein